MKIDIEPLSWKSKFILVPTNPELCGKPWIRKGLRRKFSDSSNSCTHSCLHMHPHQQLNFANQRTMGRPLAMRGRATETLSKVPLGHTGPRGRSQCLPAPLLLAPPAFPPAPPVPPPLALFLQRPRQGAPLVTHPAGMQEFSHHSS